MHSPKFSFSKTARAIEARAVKGAPPGRRKRRRRILSLALRDGKVCHWCKEHVGFSWESHVKQSDKRCATFDHVITVQQGGTYALSNGVLACRECNNIRGNTFYHHFVEKLQRYGIEALRKKYWGEKYKAVA